MKKIILLSLMLSFGLLLFTEGLYVESEEMTVVVLASCIIAFLIAANHRNRQEVPHSFVVLVAFGLFWGFSFFDLIGDHVLYHLPQEGAFYDGRLLTLGEKVKEYNDDLLAVSWISPIVSLILSLALSFWPLAKKN